MCTKMKVGFLSLGFEEWEVPSLCMTSAASSYLIYWNYILHYQYHYPTDYCCLIIGLVKGWVQSKQSSGQGFRLIVILNLLANTRSMSRTVGVVPTTADPTDRDHAVRVAVGLTAHVWCCVRKHT